MQPEAHGSLRAVVVHHRCRDRFVLHVVVDPGDLFHVVEHSVGAQAHAQEEDVSLVGAGQAAEGRVGAAGRGGELVVPHQVGGAAADNRHAVGGVKAAYGVRPETRRLRDASGPARRVAHIKVGRVFRTQLRRTGESREGGGALRPKCLQHPIDDGIGAAFHVAEALERRMHQNTRTRRQPEGAQPGSDVG